MNKLFIYTVISLFSVVSYSQNAELQSVVLEESTENPVADAIVTIEGTALVSKTNENGVFSFANEIPLGEHVVSVEKENYETKFFLITANKDQKIVLDKVTVEITKEEAKRRNRAQKLEEKRLRAIKKELRAKEKQIAKQERKLRKENTVDIDYIDAAVVVEPEDDIEPFTEAQLKFAEILDTPVEELSNRALYEFIDEWLGTTYIYGGETKDGIDCSSFTQRIYTQTLGLYIERTALKQYNSEYTDKFRDTSYLKEGDLLFFGGVSGPDKKEVVNHVGVYLHNNMFVHSTSNRGKNGQKGVKISNLNDKYWKSKLVSAGRRIGNN
ncbi:NlpC/P60 family protein [Bizionia paragorgiae]|uniref:NlpC/P60 family protein n=1 Tax=Bizionia paragorgiae TaxID=283786 RepID=UPI003A92E4EF